MPGRVLSKETVSESESESEDDVQNHHDSSLEKNANNGPIPRTSSSKHKQHVTAKPAKRQRLTSVNASHPRLSSVSDESSSASDTESSNNTGSTTDESQSDTDAPGRNSALHDSRNLEERSSDLPSSVQQVTRKTYEPPAGFARLSAMARPKSKLESVVSQAGAPNKQVWHIVAPASLPITSILEVGLATLDREETVITHGDMGYRFAPKLSEGNEISSLLIPDNTGTSYKHSNISFTKAYQLKPKLSASVGRDANSPVQGARHGFSGSAAGTRLKVNREHPSGLRIRYGPLGFDDISDAADADNQSNTSSTNSESDGSSSGGDED